MGATMVLDTPAETPPASQSLAILTSLLSEEEGTVMGLRSIVCAVTNCVSIGEKAQRLPRQQRDKKGGTIVQPGTAHYR